VRLLVPVSFGPCSVALLQILDSYLQGQMERTRRAAYELVCVHVALGTEGIDLTAARFRDLEARYPRHSFVYSHLEDCLKELDVEQLCATAASSDSNMLGPVSSLDDLLARLPSASSRADVVQQLLSRMLSSTASRHHCAGILYGHSTTRLAEKVLVATASGRGFSLPWQVSDVRVDGLQLAYPLRDLLRKEMIAFGELVQPSIAQLIMPEDEGQRTVASSRLTTIDDLMVQYFSSVETKYPSIVANVVRTSSKLLSAADDEPARCSLCNVHMAEEARGIQGWQGDPSVSTAQSSLCYGCHRSVKG
jgi:cytoplasmic tRNA 2-thiolation protein 2